MEYNSGNRDWDLETRAWNSVIKGWDCETRVRNLGNRDGIVKLGSGIREKEIGI